MRLHEVRVGEESGYIGASAKRAFCDMTDASQEPDASVALVAVVLFTLAPCSHTRHPSRKIK